MCQDSCNTKITVKPIKITTAQLNAGIVAGKNAIIEYEKYINVIRYEIM